MSHTILLLRPDKRQETHTYIGYDSVRDCMKGVCRIYQGHLKSMNYNKNKIKYSMKEMFKYLDQLDDISCLVYQKSTNMFTRHNKKWIKEKVFHVLLSQM